MSRLIDEIIRDFPIENLWLFLIDGCKLNKGPLYFEGSDEPGYLSGLFEAAMTMFTKVDEPLDKDLIRHIHDTAVKHTKYKTISDFRRESDVTFGLSFSSNATIEGIAEIKSDILGMEDKLDYHFIDNPSSMRIQGGIGAIPAIFTTMSPEYLGQEIYNFLEQRVSEIAMEYEKKLSALRGVYHTDLSKKEEEILLAIVTMIQSLERLHPFSDGNCRTFCILVLLKELLRNNLRPTILTDPNCFDGFSRSQMLEQIKEGQDRAAAILKFYKGPDVSLEITFRGEMVSLVKSSDWEFYSCTHALRALHSFDSVHPYKEKWRKETVDKINALFFTRSDSDIEKLIRDMLRDSHLSGKDCNVDFIKPMQDFGVRVNTEILDKFINLDESVVLDLDYTGDSLDDGPDAPSTSSSPRTPR